MRRTRKHGRHNIHRNSQGTDINYNCFQIWARNKIELHLKPATDGSGYYSSGSTAVNRNGFPRGRKDGVTSHGGVFRLVRRSGVLRPYGTGKKRS